MSVLNSLMPKIIKDKMAAEKEAVSTQADLRDAVKKARIAIDAAVAKREAESRTAKAAGG